MEISGLVAYIALGFFAQLIDGALGMAYGLITTSVLLATGAPPAIASASVHAAEMVTTGIAAGSHAYNRNIDWALFRRLAPAGVLGGVTGALLLTGLPELPVKIFVVAYLCVVGGLMLYRFFRNMQIKRKLRGVVPVGVAGGALDAIGGGGWGAIVTSTLMARGGEPRRVIGSASAAEFFVTLAISIAFLTTLDLAAYGEIVLGLVLGGAVAAPFAGVLARVLPHRMLMGIVALVVLLLAIYNFTQLFRTGA